MRDKESYLTIKYSVVMPIHRYNKFTDKAIESVDRAIGNRSDVEFIILDDSVIKDNLHFTINRAGYKPINHIKLSKIDLLNKLIIGTQLAKGEYYCNADYDDISHPQKFELFDELLEKNDIAGANQCVFWDVKDDKTYKMKEALKERTHTYKNKAITYPWLQHSNSAVPLKWLRKAGYDGGRNMGMYRDDGKMLTDSPIWARAVVDGLKFGFFDDINPNSWRQCWQILTGENVNVYDDMGKYFEECDVEKPKVLR